MDDRYLFHIRERCSWPRITRLRHKSFYNTLLHPIVPSQSNPNQSSTTYTHPLRIRLQPFERTLLSKTLTHLKLHSPSAAQNPLCDISASHAATILFYHWSWADNVLRLALTELDPEWVAECHGGNFDAALDIFQSTLQTRIRGRNDLYDRRYYRTEQLMRDNIRLGEWNGVDIELVTVVPCEEDWELWTELGRAVISVVERVRGLPGFGGKVLELLELVGDEKGLLEYVERLIDETPEFPPKGLFEGMEDELDDNEDIYDEDGEDEGEDEPVVDAEGAKAKEEQDKERTKDWAQITATKIIEAEDLWDVWSLCRMLMVSMHNVGYKAAIDKFITTPEFVEWWTLENRDDEFRTIVAKQPLSEAFSQRPSEISSFFFQEDSQEFLELEFRRNVHESSIIDPMNLLPFYPWETLRNISAKSLADLESGLGFSAEAINGTMCTVSADSVNHSLYLTDDLFPPHVDAGYRYPGLTFGNRVVFQKQRVDETEIVKKLRYFLELWNDCALTYDPQNQTFYLLQTLPGLKMRQLEKRSGFWAGFAFFDLKYRYRDTLSSQHTALREMLGEHYDAAYSDFLSFIDASEIDLVDLPKKGFLGQGSFGRVYRATWARKPTTRYDHTEEGPGDVALKVSLAGKSFDDRAKFFVELATVYSALAGDSGGCVPFYGFCKVLVDEEGSIIDSNATTALPNTAKETFALVFDYANQGDILSFLEKRLKSGEPEENWLVICGALSGLANGLMTIHKKGIVHRDIHPKNVLVSSIRQAGDDEIEFDSLLSDLGEGKDITTTAKIMDSRRPAGSSSTSTGTYSYAGFMTPELASHTERSSTADDISSWGLLAVRIIQNDEIFSRLCDEDGKALYLAGLMRIMERCLDPNPAGRFDAASLVVVMDELMDGPSGLAASAYGGEVEWYDGSYELPRIRELLETDSGLTLGSDWLPLSSRKRKADSMLST
ncbi:kinase-like protein [Lentithecium fluviatile CBS 122367]|uniref:Kinase-like protein n=1 Tax=Lentithecium fluviatile CBS 122367 TaxID=1168545 RepID=A0A6G1IVM9_9PLEO|nr:kinase-like protein [Lentithecium fluviatile CBS 122367]